MTQKLLNESHAGGLKPNGDGTYNVVLITPGRGSSGFYSESMLRETGPSAFPSGTHSYVGHPSADSPERSPEKLLGIYTEAAHYEEGVGLVSKFKPMAHWKSFVEEVAPYTGLSIYAEGDGVEEDLGGETVFMVSELLPNIVNTVDLVSYAGRGGHFAESLLESALAFSEESPRSTKEGNENMALEDEVKSLISVVQNAISELTTARESLVAREAEVDASKVDASSVVESAVAATNAVNAAELPEKVKESLHSVIAAGDYNVQPAIDSALAIREEVLAEAKVTAERTNPLSESYRLGAPTVGTTETMSVKGWE